MYGVRTRRGFRGLGLFNLSDPTACGFWDFGVLKSPCWAATVGVTATPQDYVSAQNTLKMEQSGIPLPAPPAPAVPPAPEGTAVPASSTDAGLPGQLADQAARQTQGQNQQFFDNLSNQLGLNPPGDTGTVGLNTSTLIALGLVAGIALLAFSSTGRRR